MKPAFRTVRTAILLCLLGNLTAFCAGLTAPVRFGSQHCVTEWSYSTAQAYSNPFNEIELDVVITDANGREQRVPAFWAGENTWRVRYAPHTTGKFTCRTICTDTNNADLHGQ